MLQSSLALLSTVLPWACSDHSEKSQTINASDLDEVQDCTDLGEVEDQIEDLGPIYPEGERPVFEAAPTAPLDPSVYDHPEPFPTDPVIWPESQDMPLGIQAGMLSTSRALLWVYYGGSHSIEVWVWRKKEDDDGILRVKVMALSNVESPYLHASVQDLAPGTVYHYAFIVLNDQGEPMERSAIGRFKTVFLEDGVAPLRIAATHGTNLRFTPYTSLQKIADLEVDAFFHLGDMSYNDKAYTLEEYLEIWKQTLEEPNMQAVLSSTGLYLLPDDHEVKNNWDGETVDADRLAAAREAMYTTLAFEPEGHHWHSQRWGKTVEFFFLDLRSERQPSTRDSDTPIFISTEQMHWLKQGLLNSPCRFKVLLNSVPMTIFPGFIGATATEDRWQGYVPQQQELVDFIVEHNIWDVWSITGDFHFGFVTRIQPYGKARGLLEICAGPGASATNPVPVGVDSGLFKEEDEFPQNQFFYWNAANNVVTTLEFRPVEGEIALKYVNAKDDQLLFESILKQPISDL